MSDPVDVTGLPAIRKVLLRMQQRLAEAPELEGVTILIDRSIDEPIEEAERPAISIRIVDTARSFFDQSTTRHYSTLDLDICTQEMAVASISAQQADIEARALKILLADISLGGLTTDIESKSFTGNEQDGAEAGIAPSTVAVGYLTPWNDFTRIRGTTGPIL